MLFRRMSPPPFVAPVLNALGSHVSKSLTKMLKNVEAGEELDEEDLDRPLELLHRRRHVERPHEHPGHGQATRAPKVEAYPIDTELVQEGDVRGAAWERDGDVPRDGVQKRSDVARSWPLPRWRTARGIVGRLGTKANQYAVLRASQETRDEM